MHSRREHPVSKPLLFVCRHVPDAASAEKRTEFISRESPDGPVLQAFESHELAAFIWELYGSEAYVFLLPEDEFTTEQAARIAGERVLIFRTGNDYNDSRLENLLFPWADRVIRYDPASLAARGLSGRNERGSSAG